MTTVAEGISEAAEVLKDVDLTDPQSFQDPDVRSKLEDLQDVFDDEYQQASEEVSDWIDENCR